MQDTHAKEFGQVVIAREFDNWQAFPSPADHPACSPNLVLLLGELRSRWPFFTNLGCFGRRPIRGGTAPSSHWNGAAIDVGYEPDDDPVVAVEVAPWLVARSGELHLQAIHDYRRRRIWRAGRTSHIDDACDGWWRAQRASKVTGMGQPWCNHLHLETTARGWGDDTPTSQRWTD